MRHALRKCSSQVAGSEKNQPPSPDGKALPKTPAELAENIPDFKEPLNPPTRDLLWQVLNQYLSGLSKEEIARRMISVDPETVSYRVEALITIALRYAQRHPMDADK